MQQTPDRINPEGALSLVRYIKSFLYQELAKLISSCSCSCNVSVAFKHFQEDNFCSHNKLIFFFFFSLLCWCLIHKLKSFMSSKMNVNLIIWSAAEPKLPSWQLLSEHKKTIKYFTKPIQVKKKKRENLQNYFCNVKAQFVPRINFSS